MEMSQPPLFLPPSSSSLIRTDLEIIAKWLRKLISDKCHGTGAATAEKTKPSVSTCCVALVFFSARQPEQLHRLHAKHLPVYAPDRVSPSQHTLS
jgi:hypothetical protein